MCFEGGWQEAAHTSQKLTEKCEHVFYTVSSLAKLSELKKVPGGNTGCNIAFVNDQSLLFKKVQASRGSSQELTHNGWTLVPIREFGPNYWDARKPTRLPKINPGKFFAPSVLFALYGDPTISLNVPMKAAIDHMLENPQGGRAVFAAIQHPQQRGTVSVQDEVDNVLFALKTANRKGLTLYPAKVKEQAAAYKSVQQKYDGLQLDNVFDGALVAHDLKSAIAKQFRCRWYREYQKWSDRDQLSGGYTLSLMNYEYSQEEGGQHSEWLAIGTENGKAVHAHLLRSKEHPYNLPKSKSGTFYQKNV